MITNIDSMTVVDNGDAASGTAVAGKDIEINVNNYATALTIDAHWIPAPAMLTLMVTSVTTRRQKY